MAGNNSIQFLRGNSAQRTKSLENLIAGQPFYEMDTNSLYVGGSNGTPLTAATPVNSYYDRIIHNQTEFEAWYKQLDDGSYTGESVLLLSGTYTRKDGKGLHLPTTLKQLHGLGTVEINITSFIYDSSNNKGGIWYTTIPTTEEYSIENISLSCVSSDTISGAGYGYGFKLCTNLTNCTGVGRGVGTISGAGYGFHSCTNLINCTGAGTGGASGYGFYSCEICSNCRQDPSNASKTATWGGTNNNISKDTCPEYTA